MADMVERAVAAAVAPLVTKIDETEAEKLKHATEPVVIVDGPPPVIVEDSSLRPAPPAKLNLSRSEPYAAGLDKG